MENLVLSFNVIAPTFLTLLLGYVLFHSRLVSKDYLAKTNALVFKLFLPCMLFNNIYKTDLKAVFNGKLFLFAWGSLLLLFLVLCLVVPHVVKNKKQQGVVIQGIFRSNYVIFGFSIVSSMFGEEHATTAALLSAVLVPSYNVLAVVALSLFSGGEKMNLKKTLLSIAKNPLILSSLLGVVVSLSGLQFPQFLQSTITDIGRLATPLALIVLGGDFDFQNAKGNLRLGLSVVFIKLVLIPAIFIPIAVWMGFRGSDLLAISLAWETPIAVSSYIMAQEAKADHQLAGQLVVLSSSLCLVTVFLMVFILKQLGLM